MQLWVFPTRYRAARFSGTKSKSCGSLILWAKCVCCFRKIYYVLGQMGKSHASRSVSCSIFSLQKSDSFNHLTPTCLVISLVVYSLSWRSRCIHIFDDEWCTRTVQFDLSRLETHGSTTEDFSYPNLRIFVLDVIKDAGDVAPYQQKATPNQCWNVCD